MTELEATIVLDGSGGGYSNRDYAVAVVDAVAGVEIPDDIDDAEWGHEALEELLEEANARLGPQIMSWHPDCPGLLVIAANEWWNDTQEI